MTLPSMVANVIFPAPTLVYLAGLFLPGAALLALATEWAVFVAFQGRQRVRALLGLVLGANVFSWIVGVLFSDYVLGGFLPSGMVPSDAPEGGPLLRGPEFTSIAILGFLVACVLSMILELGFARVADRPLGLRLRRLSTCVVVANAGSYLVLFLWTWMFWKL